MVNDLYDHHIFGSKSEVKSLPKFDDIKEGPSAHELVLAWARGYYEGDGRATETNIGASSKELLESIRDVLNIKYPVREKIKKYEYFDEHGNLKVRNSFYELTLGALIFNEMTYLVKSEDIYLLPRKDKTFNMKFEALDILKSKLELLGIEKKELLEMLSQYSQTRIISVIDLMFEELGLRSSRHVVLAWRTTALYTFRQLRAEWGIDTLPGQSIGIDKDNYLK
ncbi:hypothetical protein LCGC14_1817360 [marine sediment metagenome]|uniref:DOD-type homing endonuclease domain-containing protein n=1 Tax=marine sediment metagenome TaxID=412755 RepID=A0A0F9JJH0_9ZZZZ